MKELLRKLIPLNGVQVQRHDLEGESLLVLVLAGDDFVFGGLEEVGLGGGFPDGGGVAETAFELSDEGVRSC